MRRLVFVISTLIAATAFAAEPGDPEGWVPAPQILSGERTCEDRWNNSGLDESDQKQFFDACYTNNEAKIAQLIKDARFASLSKLAARSCENRWNALRIPKSDDTRKRFLDACYTNNEEKIAQLITSSKLAAQSPSEMNWWDACAEFGKQTRAKKNPKREVALSQYLTAENLLLGWEVADITKRTVKPAMTECGVWAALGAPNKINRTQTLDSESSQYVYKSPSVFVYTQKVKGYPVQIVTAIQY